MAGFGRPPEAGLKLVNRTVLWVAVPMCVAIVGPVEKREVRRLLEKFFITCGGIETFTHLVQAFHLHISKKICSQGLDTHILSQSLDSSSFARFIVFT